MATDRKPTTIDQQINDLKSRLGIVDNTIKRMQSVGGFADSALLGKRSERLEGRVAVLEADVEMLMDVNALLLGALREHLLDRHNVDCVRDNDRDVINVRKALRRMSEWADKRGLRDRQRDVLSTIKDENRLRPRQLATGALA
jgi:hypothetical protein